MISRFILRTLTPLLNGKHKQETNESGLEKVYNTSLTNHNTMHYNPPEIKYGSIPAPMN